MADYSEQIKKMIEEKKDEIIISGEAAAAFQALAVQPDASAVPAPVQTQGQVAPVMAPNAFTNAVDEGKKEVFNTALQKDAGFIKAFGGEVLDAAVELVKVEAIKAKLEQENATLQRQLTDAKTKIAEYGQYEAKYLRKAATRKYYYDGVKSILDKNITDPPNLPLLWFLTIFHAIKYVHRQTLGALFETLRNEKTPKGARIFYMLIISLFLCGAGWLIYMLVK